MPGIISRLSTKFILTIVGLLLIGSLPTLFSGISLNVSTYLANVLSVLGQLTHPWTLEFSQKGLPLPLFPHILIQWWDSMKIYFLAFFCAIILALVATFVTLLMPRRFQKAVKAVMFVIESLPDVLIILLMQSALIAIYQQTGVLVAEVASYGEDEAILLPIIAMTILPAVMLYRTMLLDFAEEEDKPYVELAKSKGMKTRTVLFVHIFRNAIIQIFIDSKYILWFMLSNLLMVEYLLNLRALTNFILEHPTPLIFTVGLLLFFIPIFLFLAIGQVIIEKWTAQEMEV